MVCNLVDLDALCRPKKSSDRYDHQNLNLLRENPQDIPNDRKSMHHNFEL